MLWVTRHVLSQACCAVHAPRAVHKKASGGARGESAAVANWETRHAALTAPPHHAKLSAGVPPAPAAAPPAPRAVSPAPPAAGSSCHRRPWWL